MPRAGTDGGGSRPATVDDIHDIARALPGVTAADRTPPVYQVSGRSFIFFRTPRPDAMDPETGERYPDVIVFWVDSELEKEAVLADTSLPFFTTPHFNGHPSVLLRGSRVGELSRDELAGFVERAWMARASARTVARWVKEREPGRSPPVRGEPVRSRSTARRSPTREAPGRWRRS
jgi:hypothetical protein